MNELSVSPVGGLVWQVGALCRAVADALALRFNPVQVRGELSGFARAASGHCYFTLKDASGQLRCAMFKRAAQALDFAPRDGELVEVQGRLGVYEPRGDLQLVVEGMRRAGQGSLFEEFLRLKARLEQEGLFDAGLKRALPVLPRAIGVVTSLGAAAWHDVVSALRRRVPHIPVCLVPASVQGAKAPAELIEALSKMYLLAQDQQGLGTYLMPDSAVSSVPQPVVVDVILLVRGGGALEDLWAFNDEALARMLARAPVPVVCGVGHETDFTIADFVADLRAPTPTAAAELVAPPRQVLSQALDGLHQRLQDALMRALDRRGQRLDWLGHRLGRPSTRLAAQRLLLSQQAHTLHGHLQRQLLRQGQRLDALQARLPQALQQALHGQRQRLERASLRLGLLDPHLVLQRGYAWLSDDHGSALTQCHQFRAGQSVHATLADGQIDLTVASPGH